MNITSYPAAFPVDALPPSMLSAVLKVIEITKAPPALVVSSCIASASIATQNLVDVERRENLVGPIGLFFLTICGSGERKTTVDNLFTRSVREFDHANDGEYQSREVDYAGEFAVWQVTKRAVESDLRRAIKEQWGVEAQRKRLTEIIRNTPVPPIHSPLLLSDTTPAALKKAFRMRGSGVGIFTSEASTVFNGKAFSDLALLNGLWDGGRINIDRITSGRWTIENGRLTTSLMVQPGAFNDYLDKYGKAVRDIGLFARMFICFPHSTQGDRPVINYTVEQEDLTQFNRRVSELLEESRNIQKEGAKERRRLKFDWQAQTLWDEIFNKMENSVSIWGYLSQFKDYVAKYADNLARLAAVFHCFEGLAGDISTDTLKRAQAIADWYLNCFIHLFSTPVMMVPAPSIQDANLLESWLANKYLEEGKITFEKKRLAQYGPYKIRPVHRLNPALEQLVHRKKIYYPQNWAGRLIKLHPEFVSFLEAEKKGCSDFIDPI